MTEKLQVTGFLTIKKAHLEIKKINIIIGPQANGKSLLAKLLHFFKTINEEFFEGIRLNKSKRDFDKGIITAFEEKFPRYTWEGSSFSIIYDLDEINIKIIGRKNSSGKTSLTINYSPLIAKIFTNKKKVYIKHLAEIKTTEKPGRPQFAFAESQVFFEHVIEPLRREDYSSFFSNPIFIPATRSFFANLQKNYWSLTDDILDIDPLISRFGKSYDNAKNLYNIISKHDVFKPKVDVSNCLNEVIKAEYQEIDGDDWIVNDSYKVRLSRASSGQQEAFPMLLILMMNNYRIAGLNFHSMYIEEPEAHLFPDAQAKVVSAILKIFSKQDTNFFITTHSPYILTSINNSIYANQLIESGKVTEEKFVDISNGSYPINFSDISAYSITKGQITDIKDYELNLIDGTFLDSISNNFGKIFNQLLDLDS